MKFDKILHVEVDSTFLGVSCMITPLILLNELRDSLKVLHVSIAMVYFAL